MRTHAISAAIKELNALWAELITHNPEQWQLLNVIDYAPPLARLAWQRMKEKPVAFDHLYTLMADFPELREDVWGTASSYPDNEAKKRFFYNLIISGIPSDWKEKAWLEFVRLKPTRRELVNLQADSWASIRVWGFVKPRRNRVRSWRCFLKAALYGDAAVAREAADILLSAPRISSALLAEIMWQVNSLSALAGARLKERRLSQKFLSQLIRCRPDIAGIESGQRLLNSAQKLEDVAVVLVAFPTLSDKAWKRFGGRAQS